MTNTTTEDNAAIDAQLAEDTARARSVVKSGYKTAYAERAKSAKGKKGVSKKVQARSCGDWLALELAARCVDAKTNKLRIEAFEAILDANGIRHAHWNRTTPGWQGRLRMTGRLALQREVADSGALRLDEENAIDAPKNWIAKHAS